MNNEVYFDMQIKIKVFYKLKVSLWAYVARHAQITQNNKFAISLQYLKENVKNKVDSLLADKRLKVSSNWYYHLGVCDQACQNYPK